MSDCDHCDEQGGPPCHRSYRSDHRLSPSDSCIDEARWRSGNSSEAANPFLETGDIRYFVVALFIIEAIMMVVIVILSVNTGMSGSVPSNLSSSTTNYFQINNETGLISKSYRYVLRGKSGVINLKLHSGVYDEISSEGAPAWCNFYEGDPRPCTSDQLQQYYLKYINELYQIKDLDDLADSINAKTPVNDDQARIAISLVQQIPFDSAKLNSDGIVQTRYPYEVLYDGKGTCEEKSLLLAYLLRRLGYSVALFVYPTEKHMALGISSPISYSYENSGYAFVETTRPGIVTDDKEDYVGQGQLKNYPDIYAISDGISFESISTEYNDANTFTQLESISKNSGGILDRNDYNKWISLVNKYGLKMSS